MSIYENSLALLRGTVLASTLLLATMNVAYSHGGHGGHGHGGHHGGGYHHYHGGHGGWGHRGWGHHGWYGHGWNNGTVWHRSSFFGVGFGPTVITYPNGCVWVPEHRDRYGNWIRGHRAC